MIRKYSWIPDLPDHRDFLFRIAEQITLPEKVDYRGMYPLVYDQSTIGSCTANAIALHYDYERIKQGLKPLRPSRLFIYYNERRLEGTVKEDSGASIRDGFKTLNTWGVCPEREWLYRTAAFTYKPIDKCYTDALPNVSKQYLRLNSTSLYDLKNCLASGFTFVFGFSVYQSFRSDVVTQMGVVSMPVGNESLLGGHAICCVGYDDANRWFICRNSWGYNWGDKGHFYIPYDYVTNLNLADDFWSLRLV